MPGDYSGRPGVHEAELLRTLCALVAGRATVPPGSEQREPLFTLACRHRVEPIAAWRLEQRGDDLESWFGDAASSLRERLRGDAIAEAITSEEVRNVVDRIGRVDGARPVVLKGAALAHSHYPHPWLRPRLDTDILVSPSAASAVGHALETLGYTREPGTSGAFVLSQAAFTRTDRFGIVHALDLHWKIANWQVIAMVLSHDDIASRAVPLAALGSDARAAAPPDALLLACLHRAAHHRDSEELLWILDIHLIAERLSAADWRNLVSTARRGAVTALLARGLTLAVDRFDSAVPMDILREIEPSPGARPEPSAVYLSKDLRLVSGLVSDLRALSASQGARLLAEHLFPPAAYMRERFGARSRMAIALSYVRRIASGVPRWLAPRGDS